MAQHHSTGSETSPSYAPEAADLAQNRPLWRMMSTYGATQSWVACQKRRRGHVSGSWLSKDIGVSECQRDTWSVSVLHYKSDIMDTFSQLSCRGGTEVLLCWKILISFAGLWSNQRIIMFTLYSTDWENRAEHILLCVVICDKCLCVWQPTVGVACFVDMIAARIGLREKQYFGLAFSDDTYV